MSETAEMVVQEIYEKNLKLLTEALQFVYRRDALGEGISLHEVQNALQVALKRAMSDEDFQAWLGERQPHRRQSVDTQATDLIQLYLSLPPEKRLELIDMHVQQAGIHDDKTRDEMLKILTKALPVHQNLARILMWQRTVTMAADEEQLQMFAEHVLP